MRLIKGRGKSINLPPLFILNSVHRFRASVSIHFWPNIYIIYHLLCNIFTHKFNSCPLELELNFSPLSPFSQLMGITPRQKVGQTAAHLFQRDRHLCRLFLPPTKVSNFRSREREKGEESLDPVETFPKQVRKSTLRRLQFSFQVILCSRSHMISN